MLLKDTGIAMECFEAKEKKVLIRQTRKLDDFDHTVIRRIIHRMYSNRQHVTVRRVRDKLVDDGYSVSIPTVHRAIRRIGFRYLKVCHILYYWIIQNLTLEI